MDELEAMKNYEENMRNKEWKDYTKPEKKEFWYHFPKGEFSKPKGMPRTRWKNMKRQERNSMSYEKNLE